MCLPLSRQSRQVVLRLLALLLVYILGLTPTHAQKYSFTHYDIADGLTQSQANSFSQDSAHRLWVGTLGGGSLFDGRDFTSFSKENGLANNFVYKVLNDSRGQTWFGTNEGLSCLNGKRLTNYPIPKNIQKKWITNIAEDRTGTIWIIMQSRLIKVTGNTLQPVTIPGVEEYSVTSITTDQSGNLYVAVFQKGVFTLAGSKWVNIVPTVGEYEQLVVKSILIDRADQSKLYLVANEKLFICSDGKIILHPAISPIGSKNGILCAAQDAEGNLWAGANGGAYCIKNGQLIYFDAKNGFTSAAVSSIFCDADSNIWLGTWGDGIYKYEGDDCLLYDHIPGANNLQTIMGMAVDNSQNIWLAAEGSGLIKYDGKNFTTIPLGSKQGPVRKVRCVYNDTKGGLWIGTSGAGLWRYQNNQLNLLPGSERVTANTLLVDGAGTIWIATPFGCLYIENNVIKRVDNYYNFSSSLYQIGKDSILVGSQNGVHLVVNKKLVPRFKLRQLTTSNVFCMVNYHDKILFGTADWGLFIWDRKTNQVKNYSVKNGFNSNSIYNLAVDDKGIIWAGTGRGLNKITPSADINKFIISGYHNAGGIIAEANQNAAVYAKGKLWMGTTKGLLAYNTGINDQPKSAPFTIIQMVKSFIDDSASLLGSIHGAKLSHKQNHLTINFAGIYLKNPKGVLYQYKLANYDNEFSPPIKNNVVDYPSLPYGRYTFQVKAITTDGIQSSNIAQFSFEIGRPFYQTWVFRLFLLMSFIFIGISLQVFFHSRKQRSLQLMEKMRREEKQNIRRQTAEDFHDDLGNKLTRITILSDILTTQLDPDQAEQKGLVKQIKQNAEALYNGTKDILWALDPKSDNLYEILTHIRLFGTDFFEGTAINFIFQEIDPALKNIKVPMEYNRNITMIFKELLNNALKHSGATTVSLCLNTISPTEIDITLKDNGKGFNLDNPSAGNGVNNINNRAKRIGSQVNIKSAIGAGTQVTLKLYFRKN